MAKPDKPQDKELSEEELKNLAGFFDVLIQMDMAQKIKQQTNPQAPSDDKKTNKKRDK